MIFAKKNVLDVGYILSLFCHFYHIFCHFYDVLRSFGEESWELARIGEPTLGDASPVANASTTPSNISFGTSLWNRRVNVALECLRTRSALSAKSPVTISSKLQLM